MFKRTVKHFSYMQDRIISYCIIEIENQNKKLLLPLYLAEKT